MKELIIPLIGVLLGLIALSISLYQDGFEISSLFVSLIFLGNLAFFCDAVAQVMRSQRTTSQEDHDEA